MVLKQLLTTMVNGNGYHVHRPSGSIAIVGLDCLDHRRSQHIVISVYLLLTPDDLRAGKSDSIDDTILTKAATQYVENKDNLFDDVRQLIDGVVEREAAGKNQNRFASLLSCPSWFF